jgi:putative membrane protein
MNLGKSPFLLNYVLLLSLAIPVNAQQKSSPAPAPRMKLISSELTGRDVQFLQEAIETGFFQVNLSDAARERAQTPEIRSFATEVAEDHRAALERLRVFGLQFGISFPEQMSAKQKQSAARILKQQGQKFDKSYMEEVIDAHQKQITMFEQAAQSTEKQIQTLAAELLPALREHLFIAKKIIGIGGRGGSGPVFRSPAPQQVGE